MDNLSHEDIVKFSDYMENKYFTKLESTKKQIYEDVESVNKNTPIEKVCDFGCGSGFTTFSLMSVLNASRAIGVDIDNKVIFRAKTWREWIIKYIKLNAQSVQNKEELIEEAYHVLDIQCFPEFRTGDVITGKNLPDSLDLSYCRKLLVNIYGDNGGKGIELAIENIVGSVKPGGWIIAVEECDISSFLDQADLQRISVRPFYYEGWVRQFFRCSYKKPFSST